MFVPFRKPFEPDLSSNESWPEHLFHFIFKSSGSKQIWLGVTALVVALLSVAPIELQRRIINQALENKDFALLLWLGGAFLIAIVALQLGKFLLGVYQNWIAQSVILASRKDLVEHSNSSTEKEGRDVNVVGSEIDQVGEFVGKGISDLLADGGKLVFAIGYMIYVEPVVALVALAFFVPQIIVVPWLQTILNRLMRERTDLLRELSDDVATDGANGLLETGDSPSKLRDIFDNRARSRALKFAIKTSINLVNSLAPLSVLVFGGMMYIDGGTSLGVIVAFMSGFERMAGPLRALVGYYRIASLRNEQYEKIVQWRGAQ